jgi:hypothetical protein
LVLLCPHHPWGAAVEQIEKATIRRKKCLEKR